MIDIYYRTEWSNFYQAHGQNFGYYEIIREYFLASDTNEYSNEFGHEILVHVHDLKHHDKYPIITNRERAFLVIDVPSTLGCFNTGNMYWAGHLTLEEQLDKNSDLKWAVDNNIKIIYDYSWETAGVHVYDWIIKNKKFMLEHNVKVLTGFNVDQSFNAQEIKEFWKDISFFVIDSNYFEYQYRHSTAEYHNKFYDYLNYPTKNKKFLYTVLTGDILKPHNVVIIGLLKYYELDKLGLYSSILNKYVSQKDEKGLLDNLANDAMWWPHPSFKEFLLEDEFNYILNNLNDIVVHKPIETNAHLPANAIEGAKERRYFQQCRESHYNYIQEVWNKMWPGSPVWYTEKTWKHIANGTPFFILDKHSNKSLLNYGYEIFDELFDYSIEDAIDGREVYKHIPNQIKEFQRNGIDSSNRFVVEKVHHNKDVFLQRSSVDSLKKDIERIFYKAWE